MENILSICIPTYNRLSILKDTVEGYFPILNNYPVEVCISDNASDDGTYEYLKKLERQYDFVRYVRQPYNCGIDRNMIYVMNMASSQYIWPLGDDDQLIPSNFHDVINSLQSAPDLLILNGINKGGETLEKEFHAKIYDNPMIAFKDLWNKMPFGSFLFDKKLLNQSYLKKYLDTSHAYTGFIWESIHDLGSPKILCGKSPSVRYKDVVKTWKNDSFKIIYYEIPMWLGLLQEKFPIIKIDGILKNYLEQLSSFKILAVYRSEGLLTERNIEDYMPTFSATQKCRAKMMAKVPSGLIKSLLNFKNFFK